MTGILEMSADFLGLNAARALHEHAGNDLQTVGDPVLHLLQEDGLLANQIVFQTRFRAHLGHIGDGEKQADMVRVAIFELSRVDDQVPRALEGTLQVDLVGIDRAAPVAVAASRRRDWASPTLRSKFAKALAVTEAGSIPNARQKDALAAMIFRSLERKSSVRETT